MHLVQVSMKTAGLHSFIHIILVVPVFESAAIGTVRATALVSR